MVTIGDAIQRVSANVYLELRKLLSFMERQDPELRTTELRKFIVRSRVKLMQLYTLLKWLSLQNKMQIFNHIQTFNNKLLWIDTALARNLDELYFAHASLYSFRSPQMLIKDAIAKVNQANSDVDALTTTTTLATNPIDKYLIDPSVIQQQLSIYLKVKYDAEKDLIGRMYPGIKIHHGDGVMLIQYCNYFNLALTLSHLHQHAHYIVLDCEVLSNTHRYEQHQVEFSKHHANSELLSTLRQFALSYRVTTTSESVSASDSTKMNSNVPNSANATMEIATNSCDEATTEQNHLALSKLLKIARYLSIYTSLRLLHQQAVDICATVLGTNATTEFEETSQYFGCNLAFWKSEFTGFV